MRSGTHRAAFIEEGRPDTLPFLGKDSFGSFTPRASIRYAFDNGDNIYFTYSKGFKSGGFNISGLSTESFKPETVTAFEVGYKTPANRPFSGNFSAFYYKYKNQQVQANVDGFNITGNAASSEIYGFDADVVLRPVRDFSVAVGFSYLHARFERYPDAVFNVPIPGCDCGNDTTTGDLSGGIAPYSPSYTVSVTAHYRKPTEAGVIDLSGTLYSSSRFAFDNNARIFQPAYATLSLRAAFEPAGTGLTLYAYGRNLTDALYRNTTFISNLGDGTTYAPPRTYGVGVKYQF